MLKVTKHRIVRGVGSRKEKEFTCVVPLRKWEHRAIVVPNANIRFSCNKVDFMAAEKYKELYDLSIKLLFEEQNRFHRIGQKASSYFTVLTLILSLSIFFIKWIATSLIPPTGLIEWILLILGFLLIVFLVISWFLIFSVHKVHNVIKIPLTKEMIHFFRDNRLIDIYYALAKGNQAVYEKNVETTNKKSLRLVWSYRMMITSVIILLAFSCVYGYYNWNKRLNHTHKIKGVSVMNDENRDEVKDDSSKRKSQRSEDEPNEDVQPPRYQKLTEGYTPPKEKEESED